ncbi:metal ABC transporter substrate-binding protein [Patulibacter minatonensis]|uniref:metal ABC transporter substrate-binding protein n=1 Tax=Patulibacter minatonensis TaxID=298163 RepID=UPI00047C59F8|nr:metal ABC transporter substrate-binding protein [Patulibacter minatonensis]
MPQLRSTIQRTWLRAAAAAGVVLASVVLSGCTDAAELRKNDGRLVVLTTFTVIADMTREVAGDRVEVASITKPGAEIHGYEPTPSDLKKAAQADLVLENGMGLEKWFQQFIDRASGESATLTAGIRSIPIGGGSEYEGKPNPHAWMSTDNAAIYVENIRRALTTLDPAGADEYRRRAADYTRRLQAVGREVRASLQDVPEERRALVTCEGAFSYIARDLGLREAYLWPVNAEQEGTPKQIASTVEFVRAREVPGVFCESTVSRKAQEQVASESGSRFAGVLYVDSLSEKDGPVPTYLELLRRDARTIAAGLTGAPAR